jgi:hypothetical protein
MLFLLMLGSAGCGNANLDGSAAHGQPGAVSERGPFTPMRRAPELSASPYAPPFVPGQRWGRPAGWEDSTVLDGVARRGQASIHADQAGGGLHFYRTLVSLDKWPYNTSSSTQGHLTAYFQMFVTPLGGVEELKWAGPWPLGVIDGDNGTTLYTAPGDHWRYHYFWWDNVAGAPFIGYVDSIEWLALDGGQGFPLIPGTFYYSQAHPIHSGGRGSGSYPSAEQRQYDGSKTTAMLPDIEYDVPPLPDPNGQPTPIPNPTPEPSPRVC